MAVYVCEPISFTSGAIQSPNAAKRNVRGASAGMDVSEQFLSLDQSAVYQIRVPGRFDESWSDFFEGMAITFEREDCGSAVTTLTGPVRDQAALHGLLRRLYNLGLPLLSVNCIEGDSEERVW